MQQFDIGMIGLAVMGSNLTLNFESKGFSVACFDVDESLRKAFEEGRSVGKKIRCFSTLQEMIDHLEHPRKVMLMIKAGQPVDAMIEQLVEILEAGDVIIDGGNSFFKDTQRRTQFVESKGLFYIGTGVSGGESGALHGPSLMPGGSLQAWKLIQPVFQKIAAKTSDGMRCCAWMGENGAGHFVKMVHNGIEYGDIQLICEIYHLMRDLLKMQPEAIQQVFESWKNTELNSYLIDITAQIFAVKDVDGSPLIDKILDTAGQKGTGKWMSITSLEEDVPLTLISESVYARNLSAMKNERVTASKMFPKNEISINENKNDFLEHFRKALYASKIISYTQGFHLLRIASEKYSWNLNFGEIAMIWRGGCIIRSCFLERIKQAYDKNSALNNLLLDDYFQKAIQESLESWRKVVSTAVLSGIPIPAMTAALSYFDGYTCNKLPTNLLQAQRDFFGSHTYERIDQPRGVFFHTDWEKKSTKEEKLNNNPFVIKWI
ncbi:MAG: decarboxylating NADP(+)-dependent phosphogluconate dehydrogenase [Bacteroidales bacterium]|nr:decarboxylating NADP(+)-dependent phosphogluconate dehydrogenase [Bacteroidales bacterium]